MWAGPATVLSQFFRRNFPDYSAGFSLTIPFRNRAAQADYVTDQLQLRQPELQLQRAVNQVRVDVKTAVIGLEQARARYQTAVDTRVLAEQSLNAEQNRFQYGVSTVALVIQAQKDLAQTRTREVQAMANYTHARSPSTPACGRTLDVNHISFEEAASGHVIANRCCRTPCPTESRDESGRARRWSVSPALASLSCCVAAPVDPTRSPGRISIPRPIARR